MRGPGMAVREGSCRCGGKHYTDRRGRAVGVGDARAGERVVRPRALTRGPLLSVAGRARVRLRQLAGLARRAGGWAERWRVARGKSERGGGELGRGTGLGFGLGLVSLFYSISFLFSIPNANKV